MWKGEVFCSIFVYLFIRVGMIVLFDFFLFSFFWGVLLGGVGRLRVGEVL